MPVKMTHKKGIRYTADQKRMVLTYVQSHGRGGIIKATEEFGVSALSIYRWMGKDRAGSKRKRKKRASTKSRLDGPKTRRIQTAQIALNGLARRIRNLQRILKTLV